MYPNLFNGAISPHNFMIIVGFVLMCIINAFRAKSYNFKWWQGILISVMVNIFAILGARILNTIENIDYVLENGLTLWGGVSFFGTVLFLPLLMLAFCLIFKKEYKKWLDFITPTVPVELASIRIGCFLSGCCYGRAASFGCAMAFDPETLRIPTQLIEFVFDVAMVVILFMYEKKRGKESGLLYPLFLVMYGVVRFVIEFFRDNPTLFTFAHLFSIMSILVGGYFILYDYLKCKYKKE